MDDLVASLIAQVTAANLWASISPFAPLIGTLILFAFGYGVVRKLIKGAGRGKAKI